MQKRILVQVTNQQLYLAIGIPMLFNAGLIGILLAYINARFTAIDRASLAWNNRLTIALRPLKSCGGRSYTASRKCSTPA